ncbi:unnamed protein product [Urochloa humidicola]
MEAVRHTEEKGVHHTILARETMLPAVLEYSTPPVSSDAKTKLMILSDGGAPFKKIDSKVAKDVSTSVPYIDEDYDLEDENILYDHKDASKDESVTDVESSHVPVSTTSSDDEHDISSQGKRLFKRRNLKNLGFNATKRKELRSRYVIAEAMSGRRL